MPESSLIRLPLLTAEDAQKHEGHNDALRILDAIVQLSVKDRDLAAPPGSPAEGDRYIVAATPTGAWAGEAGSIASWRSEDWDFYSPNAGWRCFVEDEDALLVFDGSDWLEISAAGGSITELQNLDLLGIGTTADGTNPFAAKLNKALFTAKYSSEGGDGDLRATMNKEAAADTVSQLFQTDFEGRAEYGLTGDDDFHVKVSPDGSTWHEAIVIDKDTGEVSFPNTSIGGGGGGGRELLVANRAYYVRTDGDDGNDGLANTSGGAFATIQKAIDTAVALDLVIYKVTINVADGTYSIGASTIQCKDYIGTGPIEIVGNITTPGNVVISATGATAVLLDGAPHKYVVKGFKLQTTGGWYLLHVSNGSVLDYGNIEFGATGGGAQIRVEGGAKATAVGANTISAGAFAHIWALAGGRISFTQAHTLSGTPAFSQAFAKADYLGAIQANATFSGSATGKRYEVAMNSIIETFGGGASFWPGDSAGSTATGGQYA